MGRIRNFWKWFSHTNLLNQLKGKLETDFFESVYRVTYLTGLSVSDRNNGYLLYSYVIKLMIFLYICGELWYMFTEVSSLDAGAQSFGVVLLQFITMYRYENLVSYKPFYDKLATSMNSPYFDITTETRRKIVKVWTQTNKKYLRLLLIIGNSTLVIWFIYPLLDEIEYNLVNEIRLPFYYKTPIVYPVVYFMTVVSFLACAYFVMVTSLNMQAHLIHIICQFAVLADCFENVFNDCSRSFVGFTINSLIHNDQFIDHYRKRLGNLVKQHQMLLSHTKELKTILSRPMLGQLAGSGTMMCCVGYQAAMNLTGNVFNTLMACLFLLYNVFELYIICHWTEEITNWSVKIGEAIYCSGWECGVSKIEGVRSSILLVITLASKPVVFTAGGMYNMSIASFASLVKASYSALTVLLRFRHA